MSPHSMLKRAYRSQKNRNFRVQHPIIISEKNQRPKIARGENRPGFQKSYPTRTKPPANGGQRGLREAHGVCWDTLRMPERALGPNFLDSISTSKTTGLPEIGFPIVVYPKRCNSIGFARDEESVHCRVVRARNFSWLGDFARVCSQRGAV